MELNAINVRDPFILCDNGKYYMYGSRGWHTTGFDVYVSDDLIEWSEPKSVFERFDGFWADNDFWAPEVHKYKGKYYMLASFIGKSRMRGTQILRADSPEGPFVPHSDGPVTPSDWMCLDGTLYVENGTPYMVFCHEWTQVKDGEICSVKLSDDLSRAVEEPKILFKASEHPIAKRDNRHKGFVTDGPFLYRKSDGVLVMIWSSFDENGYVEIMSVSESGKINGEWKHLDTPLFAKKGGHGMLFQDKEQNMFFVYHSPNHPATAERVHLNPVRVLEGEPHLELM